MAQITKFLEGTDALQFNVLVVDDEEHVRSVTKLCLKNMTYKGTKVIVTEAGSKQEAIDLMKNNQGQPYVCALVDVVMETDHAGLELVDHIRTNLSNNSTAIYLRTGQPGQAPERAVMEKYNIDGYLLKTELTDEKLQSIVLAAIKSTIRAWPYENAMRQLGIFSFGTYEKEMFMKTLDFAYDICDRLADKPSFAPSMCFKIFGKQYSSGRCRNLPEGVNLDDLTADMMALPVHRSLGAVQYRVDPTGTMHSVSSVVSGMVWVGHCIEWTEEWKQTWLTFFQIWDQLAMQTRTI